MFISVTRLRLRSWRFLPHFGVMAIGSQRQIERAIGFRKGALLPDRQLTFWTLTGWRSADDMRSYITSGDHLKAMPKLMQWCDEASVVHWDQADEALPSWSEADARMRRNGRPSKLRYPAPDHPAMTFRAPRIMAGAPMSPRRSA